MGLRLPLYIDSPSFTSLAQSAILSKYTFLRITEMFLGLTLTLITWDSSRHVHIMLQAGLTHVEDPLFGRKWALNELGGTEWYRRPPCTLVLIWGAGNSENYRHCCQRGVCVRNETISLCRRVCRAHERARYWASWAARGGWVCALSLAVQEVVRPQRLKRRPLGGGSRIAAVIRTNRFVIGIVWREGGGATVHKRRDACWSPGRGSGIEALHTGSLHRPLMPGCPPSPDHIPEGGAAGFVAPSPALVTRRGSMTTEAADDCRDTKTHSLDYTTNTAASGVQTWSERPPNVCLLGVTA